VTAPPILAESERGFLQACAGPADAHRGIGQLERLPKWLNLVPMVAQWIWLGIRHGSIALPTAINPPITAGGLAGEGKSEYFRIMGAHARAHTADFAIVENVTRDCLSLAEAAMQKAELAYPLIVKPDIGWCGFGVRLVRDRTELLAYLRDFPQGETIILQRFVHYDGEAGLYYARHPGAARGRLTGLLLRSFPVVVGDGTHTVAELISQHPRVRRLGQDNRSEPCCSPSYVPKPSEIVRVSITSSTRVGGLYRDATRLSTDALEAALDEIVSDMPGMHVARFDVRYESLPALLRGEGFKIIEVNGAGAEAVHAWDPSHSLSQAYRIVFEKQRMLFSYGAAMRRRGHRPLSTISAFRLYFRQMNLIRRYPPSN